MSAYYKLRFEKLLKAHNELSSKRKNYLEKIEQLQKSIRIKESAMLYAIQKYDFLKGRVIHIHGAKHFSDLMNTVENYSFDSDKFLKTKGLAND